MSVRAIRIRYFQQKGAEFRTCLADEECALLGSLLTTIICAIHSRVIPTPTPRNHPSFFVNVSKVVCLACLL